MDAEAMRDGMTVYSADGEKLGKVITNNGDTLLIEKGLFFRKDYLARVDDVERIEDDQIWLRRTKEEIEAGPDLEEPDAVEAPRPARRSSDGAELSAGAGFAPPDAVVVIVEEEIELIDAPGPRRGDKDPDTRE
jgi:hypothetical protein